MPREADAKPKKPKIRVQGNFRPFGLAKTRPHAVIDAAGLWKHIEPLAALPDEYDAAAAAWLSLDEEPLPSLEDEPQIGRVRRNSTGLNFEQQLRLLQATRDILGEYSLRPKLGRGAG